MSVARHINVDLASHNKVR